MKKRNAEAQKVEESQRKFIPTCGVCDDGWVHLVQKVTSWFDGKKHIVNLPDDRKIRSQLPTTEIFEDHRVMYYRAVNRCECWPIATKRDPSGPHYDYLQNYNKGRRAPLLLADVMKKAGEV